MKNLSLSVIVALFAAAPVAAGDLDAAPIRYSTAKTENVITHLEQRLASRAVTMKADPEFGYLKSLLAELRVPASSQVLVFSKTSLQRSRISPRTPRAIYFNDDVTVGFCRSGEVLEVAASDASLGTVFYTLSQDVTKPPQFTRQTESCLICHGSSRNQGMPGHLVRSVSTDRVGEMILSRGSKHVDHSTPFEDRWGGWYVTGTSGRQTHQGNQVVGGWPWAKDDSPTDGHNITDLKPFFTTSNYLTPHSDLVALLVFEHQGELQNRLTRANFLVRQTLHEGEELGKALGTPGGRYESESLTKRIHWACEPVVRYLLFSEEAKLTEPVAGTSSFTEEFAKCGPFDAAGRSLRQFDLKTRLFRYPLSYLIYSKQFDSLPEIAKDRIYRRLWEILNGQDSSREFAHLTPEDRTAIREIVRSTKSGLPAYWR